MTNTTNTNKDRWYTVPEVWLMIVLLAGTMAGSLALVGTAYEHPDNLVHAGPSVASPLPPSAHLPPKAKP